MKWYLRAIKKYATFEGRDRRKAYWMFALFNFIIQSLLLAVITIYAAGDPQNPSMFLSGLSGLYGLFIFLPSLAAVCRRLHDIGKSGVWILISLIPLIGGIWLIVLLAKDGDPRSNKYGPDPKGRGGANDDFLYE